MWFWIAILGYFLSGLVLVLDKFILTKSMGKPVVYAFYSTIFMLGMFACLPFGVEWLRGSDWYWAIASGFGFGFGMWAMFSAVKKGEATHINPFLGAMVTIFVYLLSKFLLNEELNNLQILGIIILIFSTLLLSFEKSKKHHGFHSGFLLAVLSGVFFAISHVGAKYIYVEYSFFTGLVWTKGFVGFVGLFLLLFPSVRKSLHQDRSKAKTIAKRHAVSIVAVDKVIGIVGVLAIQYAISLGSVTVVNAMVGIQYTLMFLIIYLLTKFLPSVLNEYFTKRELAVEILAIILVLFGSAMFVL